MPTQITCGGQTYRIATFRKNDVIKLDRRTITLNADATEHPDFPSLTRVSIDGLDTPLTLPSHQLVEAVRMMRTYRIACLLCKEQQVIRHDDAQGRLHAVLCARCDARTTRTVREHPRNH